MCVVDTKSVWWTQNLCGGHKICVGDTKSVWETQNLCGRQKICVADTKLQSPWSSRSLTGGTPGCTSQGGEGVRRGGAEPPGTPVVGQAWTLSA